MLREYIEKKKAEKDILLMTHIVIGAPDLETSYQTVKAMAQAGVDLMELQIPFSEPVADGPVILTANQTALNKGITVQKCIEFAERAAKEFPIPFLFFKSLTVIILLLISLRALNSKFS